MKLGEGGRGVVVGAAVVAALQIKIEGWIEEEILGDPLPHCAPST
jgi:hypothetical protein